MLAYANIECEGFAALHLMLAYANIWKMLAWANIC